MSSKGGNVYLVQEWQAVEYDLPYVVVGAVPDGGLAKTLDQFGEHARVLAVHHVPDVEHALASFLKSLEGCSRRLPQASNVFETANVAELVRRFYQHVHYATS